MHISNAKCAICDGGRQRKDDQYEAADDEDQQQRCKCLATVHAQVDISVGDRSNYDLWYMKLTNPTTLVFGEAIVDWFNSQLNQAGPSGTYSFQQKGLRYHQKTHVIK